MSSTVNNIRIFLSYCWFNTEQANKIFDDLRITGINISRDIFDAPYHTNLLDYMKGIKSHHYAITLISDSYLKSQNCMREVVELMKNGDYIKKILPIILPDADIINQDVRRKYITFWNCKQKEISEKIQNEKELTMIEDLNEEKKLIDDIYEHIGPFLRELKDRQLMTFDQIINENYKPLFDFIGFENTDLFVNAIKIIDIEDDEQQQIALTDLMENNRKNYLAYNINALAAQKKKKYNLALHNYEKSISLNSEDAIVNYNLALLLDTHFKEYEKAKEYYEKALKLAPDNDWIYNGIGLLLHEHFEDYIGAKNNYEKALRINPNNDMVYVNFGILLKNWQKDFDTAKEYFERAIKINPQNYLAFYNLGSILYMHFNNPKSAKEHFEKAIEINQKMDQAYTMLGILYDKELKDYGRSEQMFKKAIEINPRNDIVYFNYGRLLKDSIGDFLNAKECFKRAFEINPNDIDSLNSLGILLWNHFRDFEGARDLFEKAIKINPDSCYSYVNLGFLLTSHFNDHRGAKRYYEKAISIDPNFKPGLTNLQILLSKHPELNNFNGNFSKIYNETKGRIAIMILAGGLARRMLPAKGPHFKKIVVKAKAVQALYPAIQINGRDVSFIEFVLLNILKESLSHKIRIPVVIMTSFWTHATISTERTAHNFFEIKNEDIVLMQQPCVLRMIPRVEDFDKYIKSKLSKKSTLKWRVECEKRYGQFLPLELGLGAFAPLGDLDCIIYGIETGILLDLWNSGIKYLHIRSINNPTAIFNGYFYKRLACLIDNGADVLVEVTAKTSDSVAPVVAIIIKDKAKLGLVQQNLLKDHIGKETLDEYNSVGTGSYLIKLESIFKCAGIGIELLSMLRQMPGNDRARELENASNRFKEKFDFYPIFETTIPTKDKLNEIEYPNVRFERFLSDITQLTELKITYQMVN